MATERVVGGLSCSAVLGLLSDYLDDELAREVRARVEVHLAGCDACASFGGEFSQVVRALHRQLGGPGELPAGVARRLDETLGAGEPEG